ncbi:pyridoxal phosphate-dependent aminotransferase family protein [Sulfurovum sp. zt1-1]|uniref:Pyridoxal phosphate-dependent aminotransferase family protein n=1 Tax=Sulfurovum zhangzhouensis TaxID=3019067 RepID=A0ABT7QYI1_9BACT|nr:pyridoxal phosphate-dependent aminotransferase family protein [Sulfurovum zhangzhouensis]MDM5271905.1 pyridoxal phosphate-dependent aminotransferase family protein [Sulfurovum zhangzhouensis]
MTKRMKDRNFSWKTHWDIDYLRENDIYTWFQEIERELEDGWVIVNGKKMLMLGGYSYLGLNRNPQINQAAIDAIEKFGTGMSGSRFLAGTTELHTQLEKKIASLHGKEDAMVLTSGYLTNVSTIAALVGKNDYILSDKLNHASIIDGAIYSQAKLIRYKHNDPGSLEAALKSVPESSKKLVITDSVFSMSGEVVNLPDIIKLCKKYGALLMVDECHSMFVLGEKGGGIVEYFGIDPDDIDIIMSTLSKAIPAGGGYVTASKEIIDYLKHESRGFIYSIALSSIMISVALKALDIFERDREKLVAKLHTNTKIFSDALLAQGVPLGKKSVTSIVPIIVGDANTAAIMAKKCQERELYIHAVFPPVVPPGQAILRASITAEHTKEDLLSAAEKIYQIFKEAELLQ